MRALVILLTLLVATASAQEPTPDPTPPHLYYPLAVGNVWEYVNLGLLASAGDRYLRREIARDTLIDGVRYFVEVRTRFGSDGEVVGEPSEWVLRFDTTTATVRSLDGYQIECPFDSDFETSIHCWSDPGDGFPAGDTFVFGGLDAQIPLGRTGEERLDVRAIKSFEGLADLSAVPFYAPPIGLAGAAAGSCACWRNLLYARVSLDGGVYEVGERFAVAVDDRPEPGALAVSVAPNPSAGLLAVLVEMPAPADVTFEAFDTLGRRVWRESLRLGADAGRVEVDASGWAPGLYVVRATSGGEAATATVVRR